MSKWNFEYFYIQKAVEASEAGLRDGLQHYRLGFIPPESLAMVKWLLDYLITTAARHGDPLLDNPRIDPYQYRRLIQKLYARADENQRQRISELVAAVLNTNERLRYSGENIELSDSPNTNQLGHAGFFLEQFRKIFGVELRFNRFVFVAQALI